MTEKLWVAVDGHGNEYAFSKKPSRDFPNLDLRVKWGQRWVSGSSCDTGMERYGVKLPKGTIEYFTGKKITYIDEPVLVSFEDYGNYTETRPEVLEKY